MKPLKKSTLLLSFLLILLLASTSLAKETGNKGQQPIVLKTMGSLYFGGTVSSDNDGETFHGDHGYAQYFIPKNSRTYPLVMWHGLGQSGRTWETTPDGREGFMQILPRQDWSVYIIDQPRRGRAGRTQATFADPNAIPTTARESAAWSVFRLGTWNPPNGPTFFPGVQFPQDAASIEQFLRQQTPNTGDEPSPSVEHRDFMADTMVDLFRQIGPGILITHSRSGQYGWATAMKQPELIKAIVAYEPGAFAFPEDEPPVDIATDNDLLKKSQAPQLVPKEDFLKLTKMPILVVFGDNIAKTPSSIYGVELWRMDIERAKQFVEAVNRHGGDAVLVELPEFGIHGNTHFPFADLNNVEIADYLTKFLKSKGLDGRNNPHSGPGKKAI
ncbi:alpha/beta fold hydrolase [Sporomusa aerivorans]|uniref:alpha/beta hydrolase n=1 Tax=Sporomusa aerivorans TaxID=204936 RepID=UPI00352A88F2